MLIVARDILENKPLKPPIEDYIDLYKSSGLALISSSPETLEAMSGISFDKTVISFCYDSANFIFAKREKSREQKRALDDRSI